MADTQLRYGSLQHPKFHDHKEGDPRLMAQNTARRISHWYCQANYPDVILVDNPLDTLALEGCGPCSLAHALIAQGIDVTPPQAVDALNRAFPDGSWTGHYRGTLNGHVGPTAERVYGCRYQQLWPHDGEVPAGPEEAEALYAQLTQALEQDRCVVVSAHGEGLFRNKDGLPYTSLGHYICFYAIDPDGTFVAADSSDLKAPNGECYATGAALYSPAAARALLAVVVAHPERHEAVAIWRE